MIIEAIGSLVGVVVGWVLKSLTEYLGLRRSDIRTYNQAIFFILRTWKDLLDYDRGTDYFRKKKPTPEQFESWRAILAGKFIDNSKEHSESGSEAVRILSEADPAMATRLDNTIRRILSTFPPHVAELAKSDPERYRQLIYNQDYIVDLTLSNFEKVANVLAARSGLLQQFRVRQYFRSIRNGTKEFNEGMNEQDGMLNKVVNF